VEKTGDGNFMTQGVASRHWEEKESGADRAAYGISVARLNMNGFDKVGRIGQIDSSGRKLSNHSKEGHP